jgi:hypothetical protein
MGLRRAAWKQCKPYFPLLRNKTKFSPLLFEG